MKAKFNEEGKIVIKATNIEEKLLLLRWEEINTGEYVGIIIEPEYKKPKKKDKKKNG